MRVGFLAMLSILAIGGAAHAQGLRLHHPADANRDGVVSDLERAEYEAAKGGPAPWDEPSAYSVTAPPASGPGLVFNAGDNPPGAPSPARLEDRAVKASGFEEYINAEADKKRWD
ncbi:hypothetical protein [Phenylobacterium sp.]|uniref:hypothetical protein n=1 Tax=Phenylobacterium sp. TaxID=1871053 RepID=UPI00272FC95E|nr:hypothetical protein [Phenylobacterium sp.]MDP2212334.1 hypothetical protein [Phenylobacterium sp.]